MSNLVKVREAISESIEIDAEPDKVWALVSDLRRMGEWSPQCRKMFVLRDDEIAVGTRTINVNRKGLLWWPTQSVVTAFEANRVVEFKVVENGSRWRYELAPLDGGRTLLTESRLAPHGVFKVSVLLQRMFLGGVENFEQELERGIHSTLSRIKREVEQA